MNNRVVGVPNSFIGVLALVILLTGCLDNSGNRDSDSETLDGGVTATCEDNETRNTLIDELSSKTLELSLCTDDSDLQIERGSYLNQAVYDNGMLSFTSEEVDRPRESHIEISSSTGELLLRINIAIQNVSGNAAEKQADTISAMHDELRSLQEDRTLFRYLLELAYLGEEMAWSTRKQALDSWTPSEASGYQELSQSLERLAQTLSDYRSSQSGETDLEAALEDVEPLLAQHGQYGAERLAELLSDLRVEVPDISAGTLAWREQTATVSRRLGNTHYGSFSEGEWKFHAPFQFIPDVLKRGGNP